MAYTTRIDRNSPGCLIFLIDQSTSMSEPIAGAEQSKASAVADQLNGILFELIQRCSKAHGEAPRPYFSVAVIGYGTTQDGQPVIGSCLPEKIADRFLVTTTDLAYNPKRLEQRQRTLPSGQTTTFRFPVWIDAKAEGGTPMCATLNLAGQLVRSWIDDHPNGFPPIVINLTDGESTDGDPAGWAQRVRGLKTADGAVLLFNVAISSQDAKPVMFPSRVDGITDRYGQGLFAMSSELPEFMRDAARQGGFAVDPGARGFAMNANFQSVMTFLNIGTQVTQLLR